MGFLIEAIIIGVVMDFVLIKAEDRIVDKLDKREQERKNKVKEE